MLGYIISDKENINVDEHEIQSFDIIPKTYLKLFYEKCLRMFYILNGTNLNIFVIKNKKILYKHCIINNESFYKLEYINMASSFGHVQVLEWFKHSGYEFKYKKDAIILAKNIIILKFFIENIHVKKIIKWSKHAIIKTIKFKTKKRYFKGYRKN